MPSKFVKLTVVLSSRGLNIPKHIAGSVDFMSCALAELFRALAKRGAKQLYIDGGATAEISQSRTDSVD